MLWYWHVLVQDVEGKLWDFTGNNGHETKALAAEQAKEAFEDGTIMEKLEAEGCPEPPEVAVLAIDAILQ